MNYGSASHLISNSKGRLLGVSVIVLYLGLCRLYEFYGLSFELELN
ncbi:hypothetical protein HMPREF9104_00795 [Lentilactobacillus kisonensis F0435]|uniref:Uncharacterized protein n=1 Tax=Lentilactobacillus kisonensis F0435 TaxID=797516 RepID=H1LDX0_9LACO|nr:hypothetical protein HMPREF9104_00795 [Lentilactobacillus kisonensis F0435]